MRHRFTFPHGTAYAGQITLWWCGVKRLAFQILRKSPKPFSKAVVEVLYIPSGLVRYANDVFVTHTSPPAPSA
jgi:hypothetical protein